MCQCTFGVAPSSLMVLPANRVLNALPAATVMDSAPMVNVLPFGMCQSPSNPMVAAATAAALGVLTPMPCIPVTPAPWTPGCATVQIGSFPALNDASQLLCNWGGSITVKSAGQTAIQVP